MPLRKIADVTLPCTHSEHNPPSMIVLDPGTYEHTCPGCGAKVVFMVGAVVCRHQAAEKALLASLEKFVVDDLRRRPDELLDLFLHDK